MSEALSLHGQIRVQAHVENPSDRSIDSGHVEVGQRALPRQFLDINTPEVRIKLYRIYSGVQTHMMPHGVPYMRIYKTGALVVVLACATHGRCLLCPSSMFKVTRYNVAAWACGVAPILYARDAGHLEGMRPLPRLVPCPFHLAEPHWFPAPSAPSWRHRRPAYPSNAGARTWRLGPAP